MEFVLAIAGIVLLGGGFWFLRSRYRRVMRADQPSAPLIQRLDSGEAGVRWTPPATWGVQASDSSLLRMVTDDGDEFWQVALLPYRLDLDPRTDELLREDLLAEVRAQQQAAGGRRRQHDAPHIERLEVGALASLRVVYPITLDDGARAVGQLLIPVAGGLCDISVLAKDMARAEERLRWLLSAEAGAGLTVTRPGVASAPPFELSWAGCRVSPPPRYLPMAPDFPRSETMDVLSRVTLGSEGVRMLDVYRVPGAELEVDDREGLEQIARDNAESWADEGAGRIRCRLRAIHLDDGRTHLGNHVSFDAHGSAMQTYAHWFIDRDGAVFRVGAHGPAHVPLDELIADARTTVEGFRRL
ncbi:MAG: hypothetical protein CSB49_06030 [Proteobacteria bacterium]|nr:MAG: hypothetical protein CSB49_06030 [Pseudomonadota bacterium]